MKVAINQPTYLPWLGYFDLIDSVDLFVVLDNVQFVRQSWQHRNRIKTPGGLHWLTVPVAFRGRFGQLINEVEIRDPGFCHDHVRAIELAYRRSKYFREYFPEIKQRIERLSSGLLVDLNLGLIHGAMDVLGIRKPVVRASSLPVSGKRTELLARICSAVGADEYLSPLGSAEYLVSEQNVLREKGIGIFLQRYQHPRYCQLFGPFAEFASLIDLLFNEGPDALAIMRSGRRAHYTLEEAAAMNVSVAEQVIAEDTSMKALIAGTIS